MTTILLALQSNSLSKNQIDQISQVIPDAKIIETDSQSEMEAVVADVEIIAGALPASLLPRAAKLRWYQHWGAGIDWLMNEPEAAKMDFVLTNASGVHSIQISEHILAFMLAFARNLPQALDDQRKRHWDHNEIGGVFELAEKHALVVGLGAIGQHTARYLSALGMHVAGIRRNPGEPVEGVEYLAGMDQLERLLPQADFVIVTIPLTPDTQHIFDQKAFAAMKSSAYFINIGRGGTVDENALIEALRSGQIAGAGLDVFEKEPLPDDSGLWDLPNVILTAHYSGFSPKYDERAFDIFIDNLKRYVQKQPMRNVVDKALGY